MKNDINIFEVGLGGRFDATNVIDAKIGIITNISKDHTEYLGNKISEIASEKAGIIKKDTILITSAKNKGLKVIKNWSYKKTEKAFIHGIDFKCIKIDEIFKYKSEDNIYFKTNLKGSHQAVNLSLSIKACEVLNEYFNFEIDKNKIIKSLKNLKWPARFQIISRSPDKILDVAHNVSAIKNLVKNIKNMYPNKKFNVMIRLNHA
jgi:dihydrofolate synthase/folylpolyglutamate synthase